jgi:EmrB/QacA subfamily drug resistance transporter
MPDTTPEITVPDQRAAQGRTLVLAACLMATFMAAIESTIVSTAMPTIVGSLGGFELFTWVFTIFLLTQAVSIPIYGRLADMFGRKRVFFFGVGLFLTGSILCGFAWAMVPLIAFRALQGMGAGAVQPISATILGDIYTPAERAKVQGLVSGVFGVSAILGPTLGAFLIARVSWSAVFWVSVPIGVASVLMVGAFLRETAEPKMRRIDFPGALLLLIAAGGATMALVQGGQLSGTAMTVVLTVTAIATVLLLLHEARTPEPMLPLELWRHSRVIAVGSMGSFAAGALLMGVTAFLPAYVQGAMGGSSLAIGIVIAAMSVSWTAGSIVGGRIMVRTTYRFTAVLGCVALVAGCAILILIPASYGVGPAGVGAFVIGLGMGFCMSTFIVSIQAAVPWGQRGAATSSTMFLRFMGSMAGASGCGAVLNATILRLDPGAAHALDRLLEPTARAALAPAEREHLTALLAAGLHNAWLLAGVFSVLALVFAVLMPARLSARDQGRA